MTLHDTLREHVTFDGWLLAETALHVGTGQPTRSSDAGVVRDFYHRPLIPGSSFKGALRSAVERRVAWLGEGYRTCLLERGREGCLSTDEAAYKKHRELAENEDRGQHFLRRLRELRTPEALCDPCRLFGSRVFAGKLLLNDLPLAPEFEAYGEGLSEIRDGVGINRDSGTAEDGIKFDYEVVPSLTAFRFHATAENLDARDWALLSLGLLEMMAGEVAVGGKSTRGLGRCRLRLERIRRVCLPDGGDELSRAENLLKLLRRGEDTEAPLAPQQFLEERLRAGMGGNGA